MADNLDLIGGVTPATDPNLGHEPAHIHTGTSIVKSLSNTATYPSTEQGVKDLMAQEFNDTLGLNSNGFMGVINSIINGIKAAAGFVIDGAINLIGWVVDIVKAGFEAVLGGLADALFGSGSTTPELQQFRDGQLDIVNRVDLLEGIQGYCAAYQTVNVNAEWGLNNWRDIPFKGPLGPAKNMLLDTTRGEIVMSTAGMFVVYAKIHARKTGYDGGNYAYMEVECLRPDRTVYATCHVDQYVRKDYSQTFSVAWPVVTPGEGYRIRVRSYTSNWRWWDGGASKATLHVIQHSRSSINAAPDVVPDEAE